MTAYNREQFITSAIKSVLKSTYEQFELIIVDDCSTDKKVVEIQKFSDPRIKLIRHNYNQGINAGLNDAFNMAKGQYFVFIASDDMLEPDHLKFTCEYLDNNQDINIVYCSLHIIDDNNQLIKKDKPWIQPDRDRFEILMELFMDGNVILSPGMVARKDALEKIMPLDLSMLHHQDYQMHINLLMENNIYFTAQQLVRYRQISGSQTNISARSSVAQKRENLEQSKLMDSFLQIKDATFLRQIFGNKLDEFGEPNNKTIPYFLGRLALCSKNPEKQNWGYHTIMNFIGSKENLDLLNALYEFSFKNYITLVNKFTLTDVEKKYKKYRKLFNIFLLISVMLVLIIIYIV
jgi:glycosyltransferase involved in cell wall biosynthesis